MECCKGCPSCHKMVGEDPTDTEDFCHEGQSDLPDHWMNCPRVEKKFVQMNLAVKCLFCHELYAEIIEGEAELYCEIHNCPLYWPFVEYENALANGEIA